MSVEIEGRIVRLKGRCEAADAELLLSVLTEGADKVDLTDCEHLHAAMLQLLLASAIEVTGTPSGFIAQWLLPLLQPAVEPVMRGAKD